MANIDLTLPALDDSAYLALQQRLSAMLGGDRPVEGVIECPACGLLTLRYRTGTHGRALFICCLNLDCPVDKDLVLAQGGSPRFVSVDPGDEGGSGGNDTLPLVHPQAQAVVVQGGNEAFLWYLCKHHVSFEKGAGCAAGVVYEEVVDRSGRRPLYPCLRSDGVSSRCPRVAYRTIPEAIKEAQAQALWAEIEEKVLDEIVGSGGDAGEEQ